MRIVKAILCDLDGSIMPQGGPMDPRVAAIIRFLNLIGIPIGPSTGKNADYSRGLAVGMGFHWNFISAESGAQFLRLVTAEPIPIWEQRKNLGISLDDLALFHKLVQIDNLQRKFLLRNQIALYRPELKEGIISLFPNGTDIEATREWLAYFQEVARTHRLNLVLKRHGDGCIDIVPEGISKRLGVVEVSRLCACEPKEILTVVDGANDHELCAGTLPIAVSNAVPEIKEIAKREDGFLASLPNGLGFAEGLLRFSRQGLLPAEIGQVVLKNVPEADTEKSRA